MPPRARAPFSSLVPALGVLFVALGLLVPTLSAGCQGTCVQSSDCGSTEYCAIANGACLSSQPLGFCKPRPTLCSEVPAPVCGCDGVSYNSSCAAALAGSSIASTGLCKPKTCQVAADCASVAGTFCLLGSGTCTSPTTAVGVCAPIPATCPPHHAPVCGCDGVTYENSCEAQKAGTSVASSGACQCAGKCSADKNEFCDFPSGQCTLATTGTCKKKPETCPPGGAQVCGCDGKTYQNACDAALHEMPIFSSAGACSCGGPLAVKCPGKDQLCDLPPGSCLGQSPIGVCKPIPTTCDAAGLATVCGCNNKTYPSDCAAAMEGQSVSAPGECSCGGPFNVACLSGADGERFCQAPAGSCIGTSAAGTCKLIPQACPRIYAPVCGCDGRTYLNGCVAARHKVALAAAAVASNGGIAIASCPRIPKDAGGITGLGGAGGAGGAGGSGGH